MSMRLMSAIFVVSCFALAWYGWDSWSEALPQYKREALIVPTILLYALTLPAGLLVQLLYTALAIALPIDQFDLGTAFLNWMIKTWGPLVIVGYLQWFVLVPRLLQKWKR